MEVVGQFNLGFIIAHLDNDLYIIDQHASDEKYNYEILQKTTVIHQQPLVHPLPIEVTAAEEMTIMDNIPVFKKNGFHFEINQDADVTKRLRLISLPMSKQTQFGVSGILHVTSNHCAF